MAHHLEEDFKFVSRLRPEATSEDIYSACRDGDELYCKEWCMNPDHDLNQTDQHGFTPMHYATMYGHTAVLEVFINRGARIDIVNMGGDTLLHIAAAWGKYDIVQKLLKMNADIDCANEHGNTPLLYAAFWNFIGICEVLVKHGALVAMSNKYGDTPLSKSRPRLRKKLEAMASELGQSLVIVPHRKMSAGRRNDFLEFKQRQPEVERSQVITSLRIGEGAHATTWKGSWSGHTVAVRRLKVKGDIFRTGMLESFPHEYMKLRVFNNENLLPLLAVITSPEVYTISMFMRLGSLYHVLHDLDSEVKINIAEGVKFAQDVCNGMSHLHSLDMLLTRFDLNPHHVFIDDDLTAKLDLCHTRFSFMENENVYAPNWMAPEALQHRPEDIDQRAADMYSFAVILWEIATNKIPFAGLSPMHVGIKVAKEHVRPVIPSSINHHLQRIIDICWNADPNKRPQFKKIKPIIDKLEV